MKRGSPGAGARWEPAPWRYALLAAIWIAAIALVIYLAGDLAPVDQQGWGDRGRNYGPLAVAFVLTFFVLMPPRARTGFGPVRAVGAILLACAWVSVLPLLIMGVKDVYVRVALAPACRAHGTANGLVFRGVRFQVPNALWSEPNVRPEATCLYDAPPRAVPVEVPIERLVGAGRAFALIVVGAVGVVAAGLGTWAIVTGGLAWWLWRRWRARRAAPSA